MGAFVVGVEPGADETWIRRIRPRQIRIIPAGLSISASSGARRRSGEVGDVAGTPVLPGSSVLSSRTRGCRRSEDGRADLPVAFEHRLEESDRLGEESSARRRGDPERGLALQFNRFRNPYGTERTGRKKTLIQSVIRMRNLCVENMLSTFGRCPVSRHRFFDRNFTACAGVGTRQVTPKQRNTASTSRACGQLK